MRILILMIASIWLSGCISNVLTGATLLYDRHHVYKKLDDYQLAAQVNHALFDGNQFECKTCLIDVAVFNRDVLLAGHLPEKADRQLAEKRVTAVGGYRRLYNELAWGSTKPDAMHDAWITTKIRSRIFADASINPNEVKVVTADSIVYLMGDMLPVQAERIIKIARSCAGVKRVVKLFRYYQLTDK